MSFFHCWNCSIERKVAEEKSIELLPLSPFSFLHTLSSFHLHGADSFLSAKHGGLEVPTCLHFIVPSYLSLPLRLSPFVCTKC